MNIFEEKNYNQEFCCEIQKYTNAGIIAPLQYHETIEILYCLSGKYKVIVNGYEYIFSEGELIFINSRQIHQIEAIEKSQKDRYLVLKIPSKMFYRGKNTLYEEQIDLFSFDLMGDNALITREEAENSEIINVLNKILLENKSNNYFKETAIKLYINELMLKLIRIWFDRGVLSNREKKEKHLNVQLYAIVKYINENYYENITASSVCREFCMSYSYFAQVFKEFTGMNFTKFLNYVRIREAERLLIHTNYNITEVAGMVGFYSVSYFIKTFKENKKISPKKFREKVEI